MTGELLMEHMKFVHKDPNASGVPGKLAPRLSLQMKSAVIDFTATQQRDAAQTTRVLCVESSM